METALEMPGGWMRFAVRVAPHICLMSVGSRSDFRPESLRRLAVKDILVCGDICTRVVLSLREGGRRRSRRAIDASCIRKSGPAPSDLIHTGLIVSDLSRFVSTLA